jgi:hypothetical protein
MVMKPRLAIVTLCVVAGCTSDSNLAAFKTDGCSSFPDGTFEYRDLWLDCCTVHDIAYWKGGLRAERIKADEELQSCVASVGEPEIATLMLAGVTVGGSPYWPTQFRWGYGWPYPRGYKALTDSEAAQVARLSLTLPDRD